MTPEEVATRFNRRIGYELIAFGVVGLPIYRITAVALCLTRKPISPIEEFVMRLAVAGIDTAEDIGGMLGLDTKVVDSSLAELLRIDCIKLARQDGQTDRIQLTPKGLKVAEEHELETPTQQTIVFSFDGLTRHPRLYPPEAFLKPRELRDAGIPELRAFPSRPPELEELDIKDVITVVKLENGGGDSPKQLLRLTSIERRERAFLDAVALAYRGDSGGDVHLAFAIDGRLSEEHEKAFSRTNGIDRCSVFQRLKQRPQVSGLKELVGEKLVREMEAVAPGCTDPKVRRRTPAKRGGHNEPHVITPQGGFGAEHQTIRQVHAYEYRLLLKSALDTSKSRVVVFSPVIRRSVVDASLLESLRAALLRRVAVYVAYSSGGRKPSTSENVSIEAMRNSARGTSGLKLRDLTSVNATLLLKDNEFFVVSSFNWLSFKGDPQRTFREEWGIYVGRTTMVDELFDRVVARF